MNKTKWILYALLLMALSSCFAKGNDEQTAIMEEEPQVVAEETESSTDVEASNKEIDLKTALARAGFEIPSQTLPSIDFELENLQGNKELLSDYLGKVVFLNFWATWCGPCQSEMPAMEKVYRELKDEGFVILAVDLAEEKDTVQKFIEERNLTFPVLLDKTGEVGSIYDARSIPTTYLIDRDGNVLGRAIGVRPWEDDAFISLFRQILQL